MEEKITSDSEGNGMATGSTTGGGWWWWWWWRWWLWDGLGGGGVKREKMSEQRRKRGKPTNRSWVRSMAQLRAATVAHSDDVCFQTELLYCLKLLTNKFLFLLLIPTIINKTKWIYSLLLLKYNFNFWDKQLILQLCYLNKVYYLCKKKSI